MNVRCPECKYPNFLTAKKCRRCGTDLPDACPSCGTVLQSKSSFCSTCGELFEDGPNAGTPDSVEKKQPLQTRVKAPEYVGPKPRDLKECENCGRLIGKHVTFCTYCGEKFDVTSQQPTSMPLPAKKKQPAKPPLKKPKGAAHIKGKTKVPQKTVTVTEKTAKGVTIRKIAKVKAAPTDPSAKPEVKPVAKNIIQPQKSESKKKTDEAWPGVTLIRPVRSEPHKQDTPPVTEPLESNKRSILPPDPDPVEKDDGEDEWGQTRADREKLRASRITIKEVTRVNVKTRKPIDTPTYIEREYEFAKPQYPGEPVDPQALQPPQGMALVSEGTFLFGPDNIEIEIPAYLIDIHPVSCAQYFEFCEKTNHRRPWDWAGDKFIPGKENHPVTFVNLNDARAYATWAKKRLPLETEWEKAASGTDGRLYPWGNEFAENRCLHRNSEKPLITAPVDAFAQGASPFGCLNMVGNVTEWAEPDAVRFENPEQAILRGGSLADSEEMATCKVRVLVASAETNSHMIGFRCAKDIVSSN